ncbi:hypothetical protein N9Y91_06970 [Alphaproteobacteria bacterium]|nr:hypothetical protein [Alphaproteobacteria bacterium]
MTAMTLTIPDWEMAKGKPCCAVLACAVAAQRPFKDAWRFMTQHRGRTGRWRGVMYDRDMFALLDHLGVKFKRLEGFGLFKMDNPTLGAWAAGNAKPDQLYFIVTTGHAQTLFNGTVMDQRGPKPLAEFWGRRKRIRFVLEIALPDGQDPATFGLPLFDFARAA